MIQYHNKNIKHLYKGEKTLPDDYQEVEYLESTGTQYINIGTIPNDDYTVNVKFLYSVSSNDGIYGVTNGSIGFYLGSAEKKLYLNGGSYYFAPFVADKKYTLVYNKNTAIVNNIKYDVHDKTYISADFWLFARKNTSRATDNRLLHGKIYSFKMITSSNNDYINLAPCYRKSDNKPGMYDLVSGEFFTNQGEGEFITGPAVKKKVKFIVKDNRVIYADESLLPSEYRKVKYIESHGNQYIDTNYIPNGKTTTFCKYVPLKFAYGANTAIYGARVSSEIGNYSAIQGGASGSGSGSLYNIAYLGYNNRAITLNFHLSIDNTVFIYHTPIGGNYKQLSKKVDTYYTKADFTSGYTMYVSSVNQNGKNTFNSCIKMNILYCLEDNNMKLYIIPVVRNSDNKPGMYDLVSNTFFTNKGTGEFTWEEL